MSIRDSYRVPMTVCDSCHLIHQLEHTHCADCGDRMVDDPVDEWPIVQLYYDYSNTPLYELLHSGPKIIYSLKAGDVPEDKAREQVKEYFRRYPNLKSWYNRKD